MINQEVSPDSFIHLMSTYPITDDLGLSLISNFSNNSTGMNSSLDKYKNLFVKINKSSYMNFLQTKTDTDTVYFDFIELNEKLSVGIRVKSDSMIIDVNNGNLITSTNYSRLISNYKMNIYKLINDQIKFPTIDSQSIYSFCDVLDEKNYLTSLTQNVSYVGLFFGQASVNSISFVNSGYLPNNTHYTKLKNHLILNHNKLITVSVGLTSTYTPTTAPGTFADVNSICPIYCTHH